MVQNIRTTAHVTYLKFNKYKCCFCKLLVNYLVAAVVPPDILMQQPYPDGRQTIYLWSYDVCQKIFTTVTIKRIDCAANQMT